jgi:hypothetical protein
LASPLRNSNQDYTCLSWAIDVSRIACRSSRISSSSIYTPFLNLNLFAYMVTLVGNSMKPRSMTYFPTMAIRNFAFLIFFFISSERSRSSIARRF